MTRQEALNIAKGLHETHPPGFEFNELKRVEIPTDEGETVVFQWRAEWVNWNADPAEVIIERWADVYTDADPEPADEDETEPTDETDTENATPGV